MSHWKLCYTDQHVLGVTRLDWMGAPARGVLALLYPDPTGRVGHITDSNHFYHWPPWLEHPVSADAWGVMDHLIERDLLSEDEDLTTLPFSVLRAAGIKLGRTIASADWRPLWLQFLSDPDFPPKSAAEPWERLPK